MLHRDPNQRPKDLIVLAEMIRQCLLKLERRRQFADKYGLPFRRTIPPPVEIRSARWLRGAVAVAVLLLAAAVMAPVLFPQTIGRIMHRSRDTKNIGVLVGVPQSSSRPANQITSGTLASTPVASQGTNTSAPLPGESPVNAAMASNSSQAAPSTDVQPRTLSGQTSVAQTQAPPRHSSPRLLISHLRKARNLLPRPRDAGAGVKLRLKIRHNVAFVRSVPELSASPRMED